MKLFIIVVLFTSMCSCHINEYVVVKKNLKISCKDNTDSIGQVYLKDSLGNKTELKTNQNWLSWEDNTISLDFNQKGFNDSLYITLNFACFNLTNKYYSININEIKENTSTKRYKFKIISRWVFESW